MVPTELTYQKLEDITNTFSEEHKVGSGGYGNVYRVRFINLTLFLVCKGILALVSSKNTVT